MFVLFACFLSWLRLFSMCLTHAFSSLFPFVLKFPLRFGLLVCDPFVCLFAFGVKFCFFTRLCVGLLRYYWYLLYVSVWHLFCTFSLLVFFFFASSFNFFLRYFRDCFSFLFVLSSFFFHFLHAFLFIFFYFFFHLFFRFVLHFFPIFVLHLFPRLFSPRFSSHVSRVLCLALFSSLFLLTSFLHCFLQLFLHLFS